MKLEGMIVDRLNIVPLYMFESLHILQDHLSLVSKEYTEYRVQSCASPPQHDMGNDWMVLRANPMGSELGSTTNPRTPESTEVKYRDISMHSELGFSICTHILLAHHVIFPE